MSGPDADYPFAVIARSDRLALVKLLTTLLFALVGFAPLPAQDDFDASARFSRYTQLADCIEIYNGMPDHDIGLLRCDGLDEFPIWWRFAEGTRIHLGFGSRPNTTGTFGRDRDDAWLIEWRGVEREGVFEPYAVIARMTFPRVGGPTDGQSFLYVYRLRDDGTSCMIGSDILSNDEARAFADRSREAFECLREPKLWSINES